MITVNFMVFLSGVPMVSASDSEDDPFGFSDDFNDYSAYDWDLFNSGIQPPQNPPPQGSDGTPYLGVGQGGNLGRATIKQGLTGRSDCMIEFDGWTKNNRGELYFVFYSLQNVRNGGYAFMMTTMQGQFSQFVKIDRGIGLFIPIGNQVNTQQLNQDVKYDVKVVVAGDQFYAWIDGVLAAVADEKEYVTSYTSYNPYDVWDISPMRLGGIENHLGFINMITPIGVDNVKLTINTIYSRDLSKWNIPNIPGNNPQMVQYWRYQTADNAIELESFERIDIEIGVRPFGDFVFECDILENSNTGTLEIHAKYNPQQGSSYIAELDLAINPPTHQLIFENPPNAPVNFGSSSTKATQNGQWHHLKMISISYNLFVYLDEDIILSGSHPGNSIGNLYIEAVNLNNEHVLIDNTLFSVKSLWDDATRGLTYWNVVNGNPNTILYNNKMWLRASYDDTTPQTREDSLRLRYNWVGYSGFQIEADICWKSNMAGYNGNVAFIVFGEHSAIDWYALWIQDNQGALGTRFVKNYNKIGEIENDWRITQQQEYHLKIRKESDCIYAYIDNELIARAPLQNPLFGEIGFFNDDHCEFLVRDFNVKLDTDEDGVLDAVEINGFDTLNDIGLFQSPGGIIEDYARYRVYLSSDENVPVFCAKYLDDVSFQLKLSEWDNGESQWVDKKTQTFEGLGHWTIYKFNYVSSAQGEIRFKLTYTAGAFGVLLDWIGYRSKDFFAEADLTDGNDEWNAMIRTVEEKTYVTRIRGQWEIADYDSDAMSDRFEDRMIIRTSFDFAMMYEDNWDNVGNRIVFEGIEYERLPNQPPGIGPNSGVVLAFLKDHGQGLPEIRKVWDDYLIFNGPTLGTVYYEAILDQFNADNNDDYRISNIGGREAVGSFDTHVTNERYAILGTIHDPSNVINFWNGVNDFRTFLRDQGYLDDLQAGFDPDTDHIATLWYDGIARQMQSWGGFYTPTDVDDEFTDASLEDAFIELDGYLSEDDSITLFLFSHGEQYIEDDPVEHTETKLQWVTNNNPLTEGYIKAPWLENKVDAYISNALRMEIIITSCYSGGFLDNLMDEDRVIITSSDADHKDKVIDDKDTLGNSIEEGPLSSRAEFLYYFNSALDRYTPFDNDIYSDDYVHSDLNGNGYVSIVEAFNYAYDHDSHRAFGVKTPQYDDDATQPGTRDKQYGLNIYI